MFGYQVFINHYHTHLCCYSYYYVKHAHCNEKCIYSTAVYMYMHEGTNSSVTSSATYMYNILYELVLNAPNEPDYRIIMALVLSSLAKEQL